MGYYADLIKEKRNSVQDKFSYKGALITILKKSEGKYTYTVTKDGREEGTNDVYPTQDKAEAEAKREVETNWNEKEEKDNENFHYLGKTFSVTSGNFQQVRQQVQKAYWDKVKELEVKLRSAQGAEEQRIEKELREIREGYKETLEEFDRFNEKEEGYYAKLAEEKKNYDRKASAYRTALSLWRSGINFSEMKRKMQEEYHFSYEEAITALDKVAGDEKNRDRNEIARKYNK